MKSNHITTVATYAILLTAGAASFVLPDSLPGEAFASPANGDTIRIEGVVRDFRATHPDFGVVPDEGYGHYADLVSRNLGPNQSPVFVGDTTSAGAVTEFTLNDGQIVTNEPFVVEIAVIGSAMDAGGYYRPATVRINVDATTHDPFGPYEQPVEANVSDNPTVTGSVLPGTNPRKTVIPGTFDSGSVISVVGRSWKKTDEANSGASNDHWIPRWTADSAVSSDRQFALRHGDPVPTIPGAGGQLSIGEYVADYVDTSTDTMALGAHQIIYVYEIGQDDPSGGDFQDLVVLVSLATDSSYFENHDSLTGQDSTTATAGGGYKVNAQWLNADGHPIPPHLASTSSGDLDVIVSTPVTTPDATKGVVDSWDPAQGPYDGSIAGDAPNFIVDPSAIPSVGVPGALSAIPSQGDVSVSTLSTVTLSADAHYGTLQVDGILLISGDIALLCDGGMHLGVGARIELQPGAQLTLYLMASSSSWNHTEVNINTFDPSRVQIYNLSTEQFMIHNHAQVCASVISPNAPLHLANEGQFYGNFTGEAITFDNHGQFHLAAAGPVICGTAINDTAGTKGAASDGAITSVTTFGQWFNDVLGANLSTMHPIALTWNGPIDAYEYSDNSFEPIGDILFGYDNGVRNDYFTYSFVAQFTHSTCAGYYFEFEGADDVWVYIGGKLALDLGGIEPGTPQRVEFDRLQLADGAVYPLHFFYAHRTGTPAAFRIRTNVPLGSSPAMATVSGGFD